MAVTPIRQIWQPLLFALVLILGMFFGFRLANTQIRLPHASDNQTSLDALIALIRANYVDTLDESALYQSGIEGILKHLDPHTVYIPAKDVVRANEELEGSFFGIGVEFFIANDTVMVASIIKGGPSEHLNIHPGDQILKIDDSLVAGKKMEDDEIIRRIKGQINTYAHLTLRHPDGKNTLIDIKRGEVPLRSVPAWYMADAQTGYVKIDMFSETTHDEFREALQDLQRQGMKQLIVDVRDNPGGYMDAAAAIADEFIAGEHTLVSTRGKNKRDSIVSHEKGLFESGKLCVFINESSASASEILAGALQDFDRAIIMGRRSFGKGLVQEQFELPDHSAIRITTARYYLPSGRCIQKSYAEGKEKYKLDIIDRYQQGELQKEDSARRNQKIFYTAQQRKVYGEQGITPDEFVPLDTTYNVHLEDFYFQHIAETFAFRYLFFHPKALQQYQTASDFSLHFTLAPGLLAALRQYIKAAGLSGVLLDDPRTAREIENQIRIQFSRLQFGEKGRFQEMMREDDFIAKALLRFSSRSN